MPSTFQRYGHPEQEKEVSIENVGSTQFQQNEHVVSESTGTMMRIPRDLQVTETGYDQDLQAFFAKPQLVSQFTWSTEVEETSLYSGNIPADILSYEVFARKTRGFRGFKGTAVCRLEVNGMPFQSGLVIMHFVPFAGMTGVKWRWRNRSLTAISQQPHVILDIACETEAVLEIPFINPGPYYDLIEQGNPYGKLFVTTYSPKYVGSGSTTVDFSLFVSFKDVELVTPVWVAEGDISDKEAEASKISSKLTKLSKVARSLSSIPTLSAIAGTAEWVLAATSGVASAFGYSKPQHEERISQVQPIATSNMANYDGTDFAVQLGLSATNKIDILPSFAGRDVDETSLNYLLQKFSRFTSFSWLGSDASDTTLLSFYVEPSRFGSLNSYGTYTYMDPTILQYLSKFFIHWRGSIIVRLRFVKTKYHSGRLLLTYNPTGLTSSVPSNSNSAYVYRQIVDLRETNVVTIAIPFVSIRQWHQNPGYTQNPATKYDSTGIFGVSVLNKLQYPDTAADRVGVIVEIAGGPDFELATPRENAIADVFFKTEWVAENGDFGSSIPSTAGVDECGNMAPTGIGSCRIPEKTIAATQFTMGEQVSSLLQLMKRYTRVRRIGYTITTKYTDIHPFTMGIMYCDVVPTYGLLSRDYYCFFNLMYALSRGSVRMLCYSQDAPIETATVQLRNLITGTAPVFGESAWANGTSATHISNWPAGQVVQAVQVPSYTPMISRVNIPYYTGNADNSATGSTSWIRFKTCQQDGTVLDSVEFFRAVGDDFSCGYFVGVPAWTVTGP